MSGLRPPIDDALNAELWARLLRGTALDGLGLQSVDGKVDLSGIHAPDPVILGKFDLGRSVIAAVASGVPELRGVEWSNLAFGRARLDGLRLHGCRLSDCTFGSGQLRDWRAWATTFNNCEFQGTDLRDSMLGGVTRGERCVYTGVNFSGADLRGTSYKAAAFEKCSFRNTRLEKLDFQTSTFVDCVFEGELRDVLFYARAFEGDELPENQMMNVDFSRAKLHFVSFRGLTLECVKFPDDAEHILIKSPAKVVDDLVGKLRAQGDQTAMKLAAFLSIGRKWVARNQTYKVVNTTDLTETVGPGGVDLLLNLLTPGV